jgi:hypothetical protein
VGQRLLGAVRYRRLIRRAVITLRKCSALAGGGGYQDAAVKLHYSSRRLITGCSHYALQVQKHSGTSHPLSDVAQNCDTAQHYILKFFNMLMTFIRNKPHAVISRT